MFALVDVNSFYASCEIAFRPDLRGRPVVVLSNNDGCVIARNHEAKLLEIPMGAPYFKVKSQFERHQVAVFSSNYALYGDMSHRFMTILEELAPAVYQYSIDEAFVNLTGMHRSEELEAFGRHVRSTLLQSTGLTVGVGIGPTKTLAKLANYAAKGGQNSRALSISHCRPGRENCWRRLPSVKSGEWGDALRKSSMTWGLRRLFSWPRRPLR